VKKKNKQRNELKCIHVCQLKKLHQKSIIENMGKNLSLLLSEKGYAGLEAK